MTMRSEIVSDAVATVRMLEECSITARLFGSCAVQVLCEGRTPVLDIANRTPKDIDIVTESRSTSDMIAALAHMEWVNDRELQTWSEGTRLRFQQSGTGRNLDVSVDVLGFAQALDLRGRLSIHDTCIAPTDLFLSKVQIRQKTAQDQVDLIALLATFSIGPDEARELSHERIDQVRSSSWRWDVTLRRSRQDYNLWRQIFPEGVGRDQVRIAEARLTELVQDDRRHRHRAGWYMGAVRGILTRNWFDDVEQP